MTDSEFEQICSMLANGQTLRRACAKLGYKSRGVFYEMLEKDQKYADMYARARELMLDGLADDIQELSDITNMELLMEQPSIEPGDRRTAIDAKKWILAKRRPREYGDLQQVKQVDDKGNAVVQPMAVIVVNKKQDD